VINNSSIFPKTAIKDAGFREYEDNIQINALVPFVMTKELCAHFCVECVINMIDSRITGHEPDRHPYHASKRLFFDLTKDLALALSPKTRVNAVCPGAVLAPEGGSEEIFRQSAELNPLKTTGHPDQIAKTVTFLLQNTFVTGQTIFVDGGRHLYENFYGC
jgi:NAD(P)-dependent dehydrogenase (short-subunit alcohol dehydrogenase family)